MAEPQNGRIGGGVLKDNLERQGVDLNFKNVEGDTALLHFDVNNMRIGVNTEAPAFDLELPTDFGSSQLIATTASIDTFDISNSRMDYFTGTNLLISSTENTTYDINWTEIRNQLGATSAGISTGYLNGFLITVSSTGNAYGDIDQSGTIGSSDILLIDLYIATGSTGNATADTFLEDYFIPELNARRVGDPATYDAAFIITNYPASIEATSIATNDLLFDYNTISTTTTDTNIELRPNVSPGAPVHTLDNPNAYGTEATDRFGGSVAISGNYAIVGAYSEDDADGQLSGKAYIFNVTTSALLHTLDNPNAYDTSVTDYFGYSVAISNNYAIVSAPNEDEAGGSASGKAYIFNVSTGALVHTLDNPNAYGTSAVDRFGHSVAISGDRAIVGTFQEDDAGGSNSGKAYIFNVSTGVLVHTLDNPNAYGTSAEDFFGRSVAISDNYAIVGARQEDDAGGLSSGKAYIFNVSTGNLVRTLDNPNAYGTVAGDIFGEPVAISDTYAVVSAQGEDDAGGNQSGKAYIFNVTTGALLHTLDNPNAYGTTQFDSFGRSVAISGNYAVVGASSEDDAGGFSSGKAYIFDVTTGTLVGTLDNPNAYGTTSSDNFGESVAISGDYVIVGAQNENSPGGNTSGKAYIFRTESVVGEVNINSDWNITGGLHSSGDITFGGNLILGDSDQDDVIFSADVNSDIIPDATDTYQLGANGKRWQNMHSDLLNGQRVSAGTVIVNDASLAVRQGNIFYVSTLGNDTNVGDHQHGAFRTLKHALDVVDSSSAGPVTIHIFPGEYEEEFPLTIPPNTSIRGEDIRNTIIKPTVATQSKDVFLMEGDTTVADITIKDFFYDSGNDTGYAFRFTPNGLVNTRSPYIRNVTVITQGSVTSASDPRGFLQGDAGKGALIDGNNLNSATIEGSMLFHSATFITPGVDAITMTNGVRVEWLNSFTYFANRSLYAIQGASGLGGTGLRFGAEIRSIGSASVYGNFGAVADGADTLMYLIGHNFAYTGSANNVTNDSTLTIEANEAVELNSGKINYTSTDAEGKFKVGESFFADFETGTTSIDASTVDFSGLSEIVIRNGFDTTYINGTRIDTGNIRISGNTIDTIDGELVLSPVTEIFTTSSNAGFAVANGNDNERTNIEGSIRFNTQTNLFEGYSSSNLSFGGVYSDDRNTSVTAHNTNNSLIFTAGTSTTGVLDNTTFSLLGLSDGDILFDSNTIETTLSNSDLEFVPNGTGVVSAFDLEIFSENISNTTNNNLALVTTGEGYVKFDTTTGLVIPFGGTATQAPFFSVVSYNSSGPVIIEIDVSNYPTVVGNWVSDGYVTSNGQSLTVVGAIYNSVAETVSIELSSTYTVAPLANDVVTASGLIWDEVTSTTLFQAQIGDSRYNTDEEYLETWNGEEWQRSAGEGAEVTDELLKELVDIYTIVLG